MINLCFDTLGRYNIGYPNLANLDLAPDEFDRTWPYAMPFRIQMYLSTAGVAYGIFPVDHAPVGTWYPISLSWHDFSCDYFARLSSEVKQALLDRRIRLLFHYHEGDNPQRIKDRFDRLCHQHNLPLDCYLFISANSAASRLENFYHFSDHESFFKYINRRQPTPEITARPRLHTFTVLSRAHKWWRATVMSQLHANGSLDNSYWSYNTTCSVGDEYQNNPICMSDSEEQCMQNFLKGGPYFCDSNDDAAHNNHRTITEYLYTNSYCNLVLETLFDADQSNGAFITEKTYKCIKFGQPFIIIGAAGSLAALRADGYRTFDHVIDNSYDTIEDNSERWAAVKQTIAAVKRQKSIYQWYSDCLPDLRHNQQVFLRRQTPALARLINRLATDPYAI